MRINIPPPPLEELEHPTLPVDEANTIAADHSPKMPPKPRISIATQVSDLLTQVMTDEPSHELEDSPTGKVITVEAVPFPPHKSEASPLPVNTFSQASMKDVEASLKCLPANVSLITATCNSGSTSPSVDPTELRANANMATNHMLHMKRLHRPQETMCDLGVRSTDVSK